MFTKTPFVPDTEGVWLNLPAEVYHKAPGVSQSTLKEFDSFATPMHYMARKPKEETKYMQFGTLGHTAILEPEKLADSYYVQPEKYPHITKSEKLGTVESYRDWHNGANYCKEWNEKHSDRYIVTPEILDRVQSCADRVKKLELFSDALKHGEREVSFFKRDPHTGLLLKCRTDVFVFTPSHQEFWIFDLKKVQSGEATSEAFGDTAEKRGYHIQDASYRWITGAKRFIFVVFDDDAPFDAAQLELPTKDVDLGAFEYRRILDRYAECVKSGQWPGYPSGIQSFELPKRAHTRMNQLQYETWLKRVATGGV